MYMGNTTRLEGAQEYFDCMRNINIITHAFLFRSGTDRLNSVLAMQQARDIDAIITDAAPHLRSPDSCSSLQQRLEFFALQMHSSFLLAEMCRPFLGDEPNPDGDRHNLGQRCLQSMTSTLQAYLDMARLSILPLRSWSLTHEALSCACVLSLLKSSQDDESTQSLLEKTYRLLESELANGEDEHDQSGWAFHRQGVKLLQLLRCRGIDRGGNKISNTPYIIFYGVGLGVCLVTFVTAAQFSTPPELISITSGIVLTIRSLGGSVGLAILNAIFSNGLANNVVPKIAAAVLPLGLPKGDLEILIVGVSAGNVTLIEKIPGITPAIIQAADLAMKQAYIIGFRDVFICGAAFTVVGVICKSAGYLYGKRSL